MRIPTLRSGALAGAATLLFALVLAGCSSNDTPTGLSGALTQDDADDVAVQAQIALDDLGSVIEVAGGSAPRSPAGGGGGLALDGARPGFAVMSDTSFTRGSLNFEIARSWFALDGSPQSSPDAMTDSIAVTSRIFGADSTARYVVTVGHAGQVGIGGLNPARPAYWINGATADTLASRFHALVRSIERYYFGRTAMTIADVRWTKPTSSAPTYPSSGTITIEVYAVRYRDGARVVVERTLQATVVVTFNGTRYPDLTIDGTWHYTWDLEGGGVTRAGSAG